MSFCPFYNAHTCRSCGWIQTPYPQQLSQKEEMLRTLLDPFSPQSYVPSVESPLLGFRNKAKMVASATSSGITLGLSDGVSLTHCPLYDTAMHTALHSIQAWLNHLGIKAYDVEKKKGELKYVLLTQSRYDGSMMVRLVLRSHGVLKRIQKGLAELLAQEPHITVVTANIQPLHAAILEGEEELFLTPCHRLEEQFNGISLLSAPKVFFKPTLRWRKNSIKPPPNGSMNRILRYCGIFFVVWAGLLFIVRHPIEPLWGLRFKLKRSNARGIQRDP